MEGRFGGGGRVKCTFSESSLQGLFKNYYSVPFSVRVRKTYCVEGFAMNTKKHGVS